MCAYHVRDNNANKRRFHDQRVSTGEYQDTMPTHHTEGRL